LRARPTTERLFFQAERIVVHALGLQGHCARGIRQSPADAVGDPVLASLLRSISGQLYDLMITVGPASGGIIASSRHRLLALMRAGDGDGAAREMEQHLGSLLWMRRLCRGSQSDIAV
jgi:hypothetical protein